ncbi:MAG: flagellar biosynthesis protein FlhF [bacterium]
MRVKRYEAPTLQEALLNVKKELGSDAVILQTRRFSKGGVLGFMGKNMVEVLAATDVGAPGDAAPAPALKVNHQLAAVAPALPAAENHNSDIDSLKKDIRELKQLIRGLAPEEKSAETIQPFPETFGGVYLKLIENDVDPAIAQDIIRAIDETLGDEDKKDRKKVQDSLEKHLKRLMKTSGAVDTSRTGARTIALVGPTGVGKTTTIAKLATSLSFSRRRRVGLITVDTYRIAAVEQLKVYAEILDVPLRVVYDDDDMKRATDIFSDMDVVLIDTAGRSQRSEEKITALRNILSVCYPLDIHLVLNVNTRFRELLDITERFSRLSYNHLLFTKLDEALTFGNIINVIVRRNTGLSYVTYGQNVPDEIQPAAPEKLVPLLLGAPLSQCLPVS